MTRRLSSIKSHFSYGREYNSLFRLGLPVLVTQLGIITVSFADTMMVGAYGLDELASAAFVNSVFMIPIVMLIGFATGMTPLVGALFGRGEHQEAGVVMKGGLQLNVLVALLFTLFMGGLYFMLQHFGQDPSLLPLIRNYYLIVLASLVPMSIFNCLQQTANGTTDTASPMWIILCCNALNIFGNWVLIFGHFGFPELGLMGAGFSTLFSRIVAMIAMVGVVRFRRRYRVYYKGARHGSVSRALRIKVWETSYPMMIQSGVECGLWTLGAIVSGWFGKVQLAAYQVVNTISQLGFMIYLSFGVAISIRVANFTGARDVEGVRCAARAGLHLNLLMATLSSLIFIFFTKALVVLFTSNADVIASALSLIVPLVLYQYGDAVQITLANALKGTSYVKPLFWISLIAYVGVGAPLLLGLACGFDLKNVGVYYSFNGALVACAILVWIAFNKTIRRQKVEFGRPLKVNQNAPNIEF